MIATHTNTASWGVDATDANAVSRNATTANDNTAIREHRCILTRS